MQIDEQVLGVFARLYGEPAPLLARAPGRVNLIGEHTDYNDGFVLPMAIDRAAWLALRPRRDRVVRLYSLAFDETTTFDLDTLSHGGPPWAEYIKGVAWALGEAGFVLGGWEGVLGGDVPLGAGLSSSAAVELAAARAFAAVSDLSWEPARMAQLAQKAENRWVGVDCGIMDQMVSAAGVKGHALLIDCRSLETRHVPLPNGLAVVVMDTATRRGLVDSAYNKRRAQCATAARFFGVPTLRDVGLAQFQAHQAGLDPLIARRARHVISENQRTLDAATAMENGDAEALGRLLNASHASLRQDFEVSSFELDLIVTLAQNQPGCYGARLTGAGFGGCAVALVEQAHTPAFTTQVTAAYQQATGREPRLYLCQAAQGAEIRRA